MIFFSLFELRYLIVAQCDKIHYLRVHIHFATAPSPRNRSIEPVWGRPKKLEKGRKREEGAGGRGGCEPGRGSGNNSKLHL